MVDHQILGFNERIISRVGEIETLTNSCLEGGTSSCEITMFDMSVCSL